VIFLNVLKRIWSKEFVTQNYTNGDHFSIKKGFKTIELNKISSLGLSRSKKWHVVRDPSPSFRDEEVEASSWGMRGEGIEIKMEELGGFHIDVLDVFWYKIAPTLFGR